MPKKPVKSKRASPLSGATECHLLVGYCLISFSCAVCSGDIYQSAALGLPPYTVRPEARAIWERHRDRLLEIWRDPAGPEPGASGFCAAGYRGAGRLGLPAWGEVRFDDAAFPKLDRAWPPDVKKIWRELKDSLR